MAKPPKEVAGDPVTYAPSGRNSEAANEVYSYSQRISDSYRLGWMGQAVASARVEARAWQQAPSGFDGLDHIPEGYEQFADAFAYASNPDEIEQRRREIDINLAARERRSRLSMGQALGDDLLTGIVDPSNLIPGAKLAGAGFKAGAAKGAVTIGGIGTTQSVVTAYADPTASWEEGAIGAATSIGLGGLLGGAIGSIGGRATTRTRLELPGGPGRVTSPYGSRKSPKRGASSDHRGADIDYPDGHPLRAQADGVVTVKRTSKGGNEVHIDYGSGVTVAMLHLRDGVAVRSGQRVKRGDLVGAVGKTGNVTGSHLHYQVKVNGKTVDPMGRIEVGGQISSPMAVHDIASGFTLPDSVLVGGVDIPVRVRPGSGDPQVRMGRAASLVDEVVDEVATDFGGRTADEDLIAQYLKAGGDVLKVPKGRRTVDPRKWGKGADEPIAAPRDAMVDDPARLVAVAQRMDSRIDEIEAHPRFNREARPSKDWVGDLADELGVDMTKVLERVSGKVTQGKVLDLLRGRVAWMRDQVTAGGDEIDPVTGQLIERSALIPEAEAHARGNWTRQLGEDDIEIAAQDAANRRVASDDGTLRDIRPNRPLTAAERRKWRLIPKSVAESEVNDAEVALNEMAIDPGYIMAKFDSAPWVGEPLPKGKAIEAGDITTPEQWLQFSLNRAIELKQHDSVDKANAAALKAMRDESGPFVPDGRLRDLAIAASPMRQLKSLVPHDAEIQRSIYRLAGDGAVLLTANKSGAAAAPGGSVMMRAAQWLGKLYPIREAIRHSYAEAKGSTLGRNRIINELKILRQRGLGFRDGLDAHRINVGRAIVGFEDVSPEAKKAAGVWVEVMQAVEKGAREAGLFTDSKRLQGLAERAETSANNLAARVEAMKAKGMPDESIAMMEEVARDASSRAAAAKAMADAPLASRFETNHFSRIWHKGKLLDDPDGAKAMLAEAFRRNGDGDPERSAETTYQFLIEDPEGDMHAPGTPGFVKARQIPVSNKEAWDFIVQDPETVAMVYLRRMGTSIEMTRMFGDPFALGEIDRLTADLVERGVEPAKITQALQVYADARDRVAGGFHAKDPMSWDNRVTRVLRNATQIELMGGSLRSQVSDIGRVVMTQGMGLKFLLGDKNAPPGLIAGMLASVSGDISKFTPGGISKEGGEAMEIVTSRAAMRLIEADDALVVTGQSGIERGLAAAVTPFHMASFLLPFTVMLKEWTGVISAHNLIRDAHLVTDSMDQGAIERLAMVGIEPDMAARIAAMPTEKGQSGLNLVNIEAWRGMEGGDEAAQAMLGAVYNEVRRTVVTPSALDKPAIADGIVHSGRGAADHQAKVDAAAERVLDLRQQLAAVADLDDAHPAKAGILDGLREAAGELTQLKRNQGRAGRTEMPLLSVPFFLKSFGLGAGGKGLHGILSGVDRNRIGGLMSLMAAGYVSWYWKMGGNVDEYSPQEQLAEAYQASGIGAWLQDLGNAIDTTLDMNVIPGNQEYDPEGKTIADEAGGVTAAATMFDRLIQPFMSEDQDEFAHDVRKAVPLNNAFWLKDIMDALESAVDGDSEDQTMYAAGTAAAASGADVEAQAEIEGNGIDYGKLMAKEPKGPDPSVVTDIEIGNITSDPSILDDIEVLMDAITDTSARTAILKRKAAIDKKAKPRRKRSRESKSNLVTAIE